MTNTPTFESLQLTPQLLTNIKASGYTTPTPIQASTIPLVLNGSDVLGCAQTGTGKTAAFALPIIQNLAKKPTRFNAPKVIRTLILTPTRELALQIYENFRLYGKKTSVIPAVIFGGVNQQGQVDALNRGADVVIACPGRMLDLMNQGYVRLEYVETFVLDEADRMLDMGFIHDVRRIVAKLPEKRQTLMFSATMPPEVEKLAMDLLHQPETVKVDPVSSTVDSIQQWMYYVDKVNKKHLLAHLLREPDVENALVFSRTKHGADRIVRELSRAGIEACAIHGDKSQNARQVALTRFKRGECKVLVATDIAARGIDIAGLSHVINYDLPMEPESYVHRIGRTGRAGRTGKAISFCCIDEVKQLNQVEKLIGKRLHEEKSDWPMEVTTPSEPKPRMPRTPVERPAKLSRNGNPLPERKAKLSMPKSGQPIVIGRDGKVRSAVPSKFVQPKSAMSSKATAGKPAAPVKAAPAKPVAVNKFGPAKPAAPNKFGPPKPTVVNKFGPPKPAALAHAKQGGIKTTRSQQINSKAGKPVQRTNRSRDGRVK